MQVSVPLSIHYTYYLFIPVPPVGPDTNYNCTFPAMIDDWRGKWKNASSYTDLLFPFGFVQVLVYTALHSS